jgi:predicted lipoprotein with Yx(FWY)xxD motif
MNTLALPLIIALLVATGCGGDEETPTSSPPERPAAATTAEPDESTPPKPRRKGTKVTIRDSEFGEMLFDSNRQAIYIFENDRKGRTVCYGECAEAWPPVVTKGKPVAGKGVDKRLLGTVKRRDGTRQVTYAGRPLYFYAHEKPGEVRCHNVDLNGGFWWVIGPDGERRA